jgi:hypothetical protein
VLAEIERRLGIAERLARCLSDPRSPGRVHHTLAEMIRFRMLLIAAGYPDADDCDACAPTRRSRWRSGGRPRASRTCAHQRPTSSTVRRGDGWALPPASCSPSGWRRTRSQRRLASATPTRACQAAGSPVPGRSGSRAAASPWEATTKGLRSASRTARGCQASGSTGTR